MKTIALLFCSLAANAATLYFSPQNQDIYVGQQAVVQILITGLDRTYLGAYDFSVEYDSTMLGSPAGAGSPAFGASIFESFAENFPGSYSFSFVSIEDPDTLSSLQPDGQDVLLATFTVTGLQPGTSVLSFADAPKALSDSLGNLIDTSSFVWDSGSITVLATPEPATGVLVLSAALVIGLMRRRR